MTSVSIAVGADIARLEGVAKVTGAAWYAYEHPVPDPVYVWPVQSTIAAGRVLAVHRADALAQAGVVAVLDSGDVPRLIPSENDPSLAVLQSSEVAYCGQIVAAVVAPTLEVAREAAAAVRVEYEPREHRAALRADDPRIRLPETVNAGFAGTTEFGDV